LATLLPMPSPARPVPIAYDIREADRAAEVVGEITGRASSGTAVRVRSPQEGGHPAAIPRIVHLSVERARSSEFLVERQVPGVGRDLVIEAAEAENAR
jgi:hypothetical protein